MTTRGAKPVRLGVQALRSVFISHVHEDHLIADAFCRLVEGITAGAFHCFQSSSMDLGSGIPYGEKWLQCVKSEIASAGQLVALVTPRGLQRPWILFEAGLAEAHNSRRLFALALGVPKEVAFQGPFAVFQNCDGTTRGLTKLCYELATGTNLHPRADLVDRLVDEFLEEVRRLGSAQHDLFEPSDPVLATLQDIKRMLLEEVPASRLAEQMMAQGDPTRKPKAADQVEACSQRVMRAIELLLRNGDLRLLETLNLLLHPPNTRAFRQCVDRFNELVAPYGIMQLSSQDVAEFEDAVRFDGGRLPHMKAMLVQASLASKSLSNRTTI